MTENQMNENHVTRKTTADKTITMKNIYAEQYPIDSTDT